MLMVFSKLKTNPDGLPIKGGQNIPLGAGVDLKDKRVTLHDASIPESLPLLDGRVFALRDSIDYHERIEFALMQAGLGYDEAHRLALECEHKRMRDLGFDPNQVEALSKPYIDEALTRAKQPGYCAARTIDNQPYIDSGDTKLLDRPDEDEDERTVFDRDGSKYFEPQQYAAIGKMPFIIAECYQSGKTLFAVIEPNTGEAWFDDVASRAIAERKIDSLLRKKGTEWAKERVGMEPALSQQQLQERHEQTESDEERQAEDEAEIPDAVEKRVQSEGGVGEYQDRGEGGETSEAGYSDRAEQSRQESEG